MSAKPRVPVRGAFLALASAFGLAAIPGCGGARVVEEEPGLSEEALAVRVVEGTQAITHALFRECEPRGLVGNYATENDFRRRAVELRANCVQILYCSVFNGVVRDVDARFWRCPDGLDLGDEG